MLKATALQIYLDSVHFVRLYLDGMYSDVDWDPKNMQSTSLDGVYICGLLQEDKKGKSSIAIAETLDGREIIRITETKRYRVKIESDGDAKIPLPSFPNEGKWLNCTRDGNSLSFQFINYLGRSRMLFKDIGKDIEIEVVPDKISYESDYVELTEAIARKCSALLLEHSGSTSLLFKQDDKAGKTVLEQFIFLRQFCFEDNLMSLFESIKRNPDRILEKEEVFKPAGMGAPSKKFFSRPFSYGREWGSFTGSSGKTVCMPQKVAVTRKFDSVDTPANRLIKFAFERFDLECEKLISIKDTVNASECVKEAEAMHQMFDTILHDRFFDDIGDMDIVPQNNQVLQKREGYSQVFAAFSMIDLALQLNWRGQDDVYEGESKDVALLYEYWLFFELYDIVRSIEGCIPIKTDDKPFVVSEDELKLFLKQGEESCQEFELTNDSMKIKLYYNREFCKKKFVSTGYEGSYSRKFRPDYTLAVFPKHYVDEESAIKGGEVSYIHFDAKYRVDKIEKIIGEINDNEQQVELDDEKQYSIINNYKFSDLMKMHTYNDAIRRTVGSYVLYPGNKDGKSQLFQLYDELLPGVGAFSICPSIQKSSEEAIREFIFDLVQIRKQRSSRIGRLDHYKEIVVREPSKHRSKIDNTVHDNRCILGYLRADKPTDYYSFLTESGRLVDGGKFIFYFYAIKDGYVYSHHKDIFNTKNIRFYTNDIQSTRTYMLNQIKGIVETNELVSKRELVKRLVAMGYDTVEDDHLADYYYVLNVVVESINDPALELSLRTVNGQNGNDSFSPHSPKVFEL